MSPDVPVLVLWVLSGHPGTLQPLRLPRNATRPAAVKVGPLTFRFTDKNLSGLLLELYVGLRVISHKLCMWFVYLGLRMAGLYLTSLL